MVHQSHADERIQRTTLNVQFVGGFLVRIPRHGGMRYLQLLLETKKEVVSAYYEYGRRVLKKRLVSVPLYERTKDGSYETTLGVVMHLAKSSGIAVRYSGIPDHFSSAIELEIPEKIKSSSKFSVGGREREYFYECLKVCLSSPCGLVQLPTGSGKTEIQITLAYNLMRALGRGIVAVNSRTIYDQFAERMTRYGIPWMDYRGWLRCCKERNDIVILATPKTVLNDLRSGALNGEEINFLIVDESHHVQAPTWLSMIRGLKGLKRIFGFSATAVESADIVDSLSFSAMGYRDSLCILASGPLIYRKTAAELDGFVASPVLVNYTYLWPREHRMKLFDKRGEPISDYQRILDVCMNNDDRNSVVASILDCLSRSGRNTIVYTFRKETGRRIASFSSEPVVLWYADETTCRSEWVSKEWIRENFGRKFRVIIASQHAVEGLDLENPVDTVVVIDGEGKIPTVQRSGRSTRSLTRRPIVVNLFDTGDGLPVLKRHAYSRAKHLLSEFGRKDEMFRVASIEELSEVLSRLDNSDNSDNYDDSRVSSDGEVKSGGVAGSDSGGTLPRGAEECRSFS